MLKSCEKLTTANVMVREADNGAYVLLIESAIENIEVVLLVKMSICQ